MKLTTKLALGGVLALSLAGCKIEVSEDNSCPATSVPPTVVVSSERATVPDALPQRDTVPQTPTTATTTIERPPAPYVPPSPTSTSVRAPASEAN